MISALGRLRALRAVRPLSDAPLRPTASAPAALPGITLADQPVDWRLEFEERAAIREYDGGQAREYAEAEALRETLDRMQAAGETLSLFTEST